MSGERILVVDDEADILELLQYNLARDGYLVSCASSGDEALRRVREQQPAAVVLDVMLPGLDGFEVCRILKADAKTKQIPVLMLTARTEDIDVVTGLEIGADDYVTKPFSPRVLIARLRRLLRQQRDAPSEGDVLRVHDLEIDRGRFELRVEGQPVAITASQFGIIQCLAQRPGWVYSREQIINALRGDNYAITERTVDVQIAGLRKKIGAAGALIETVRGVGYRLRA